MISFYFVMFVLTAIIMAVAFWLAKKDFRDDG